ncbi:hypothetical protein ILUMI_13249 [Ignelater luminosus]|uniref:Exonuclease domain-containing protein n=1 Tax=Ignelater luminosus TaxID=2038154 RepID=A0A8K0CSL2_IGNLU|nr:hypothetical protein ILUMI_13249 [Ignelater luminosus]
MLCIDLQILINLHQHFLTLYVFIYNKLSFYIPSGKTLQNMKPVLSKRMIRIEKKKKKMAALLEISKLNEHDRTKSAIMASSELNSLEVQPSPKRPRTELDDSPEKTSSVTQIDSSEKPSLYSEEYLELKRLLREQNNKMKAEPKFRLREIGESAAMDVSIEDRIPLFLSDIQHLLMFSQIGHHSPYSPARWCQLDKYNKLVNTNILIIENVSLYDYQSHESMFSFLNSKFQHKVEIITPGAYKGDIVQDLATVPLTGTQMRKFINKFGTLEDAVIKSSELFDRIRDLFPMEENKVKSTESIDPSLPQDDKFPRTHLLLSGWQMVEENFPLPIKGLMESKYAGYVLTKDSYKDVTPTSPMFGIDCEMCRTTSGDLELTRVSVVDENFQIFYEELVKPDNKIIDYLTRFSGITHKMMKNVTKRLIDVQEDLRRILPSDAILVGQSLSNDLHALKMMHPYIIDTSVIYNITGDRTRKTKLQTLAREFLSERIQEGRGGHCSIEDSLASLKLTKHKLAHDLHYGDAVMANVATHVRHHPELGHPHYATSMLKQTTKQDRTAAVVSLEDITSRYNYYTFKEEPKRTKKINCVTERNNQQIIKKYCELLKQYSMNIAHVRFTDTQIEKDGTNIYKQVDKWVQEIYEATVVPGLCAVIFGGQKQYGNGCCFITIKRLP